MHEAATTDPKNIPAHMTIDPNSAEWWSDWSDWLKVAGFILGGVVTVVAVVGWAFSLKAGKLKDEASKRKEAALEQFKQSSALAIAEADAKAAEANKEAAKANERAAILEKDAADSRLALAKLQEKLAWRTITPEQSEKFSALVAQSPKGRVTMSYLTANEEVIIFADQLARMLRNAGYEAPESLDKMSAMMPFGGAMVGVTLCIKDENSLSALHLQQALTAIGVEAPGRLQPNQEDDLRIEIGTKPQ